MDTNLQEADSVGESTDQPWTGGESGTNLISSLDYRSSSNNVSNTNQESVFNTTTTGYEGVTSSSGGGCGCEDSYISDVNSIDCEYKQSSSSPTSADSGNNNNSNQIAASKNQLELEENVFSFKQSPNSTNKSSKSVCFHSITANPGSDRKIASPLDCLQMMMNGVTLVKIKANTRQYRRFFTLTEDLTAIRWVPSSKKSSKAKYSIKDIKEVRVGKNSDIMRNRDYNLNSSEECIFSISIGDDFDTLDLIAPSPEDANIWVTGLNFLIGANKSSGQKMRQKWLEEAFNQADIESRGVLDEPQTIALMKRLNNHLCSGRLKQKLLEYNLGKEGEEKGYFSKHNFVNLFYETATRPDIYFILVRYCGKDYMTLEDLQLFLEGEQGVCGITLDECAQLIERFEPCEESRRNQQLLIDGFTQLLVSPESDLINPAHNIIWQDMSQPLSHYFIATSHNTYLLEDQLKGPSSTEGYRKTLLQGARCIKIDTWDSPTGPVVFHGNTLTTKIPLQDVLKTINEYAFVQSPYPVIIHLENHCNLERQKEIANQLTSILADKLFIPGKTELNPVIYPSNTNSYNNNNNNITNSSSSSLTTTTTTKTVNEDQSKSLSTPRKQSPYNNNNNESRYITDYSNILLSPELLKYKIIVKGKKLSSPEEESGEVSDEDESLEPRFTSISAGSNTNTVPTSCSTTSSSSSSTLSTSTSNKTLLCKQLSDLIYLRRFRCNDLSYILKNQKCDQVCYLDEAFSSKLALASPEDFAHHNKTYCTQVAPDRGRIDSSNINPLDFWNCGSQMVAMNYQSSGQMMDLYRGWFNQNGGCGYVLKPAFLRERFCLFNARRKDSLPGIDPLCLRIRIISGQQLPRPKGASVKAIAIDPYVTVQVLGVPSDNAEMRTRTISNEANNPIFDESFEFTISVPELALLRLVVLDDDYINDDFIGQATIPIECVQTGYRHIRLSAYNGELIPEAVLFVHLSMTHRYGSKQKLRRKRSWGSKQSNDLRTIGIKQVDEAFKNGSNLLYQSIQLRKDVEKAMIDLCDECNLNENANIAQCLRILTLRLASCSSVNSFHINITDEKAPTIKIGGEMTMKLQKSISALDKALAEFVSIPQSSSVLLEMINESHDVIVRLGLELNQLSIAAGIKGRKADKAVENFMWNLSLIKTEIDILRAVKDDSECALKQLIRLSSALERLFTREREAANIVITANPLLNSTVAQSSSSVSALVSSSTGPSSFSNSASSRSVLTAGHISLSSLAPTTPLTGSASLSPKGLASSGLSPISLTMEIKPNLGGAPLTPTSPGDARLRGILKKPSSSPTTPIPTNLDCPDERINYFQPMTGERSPPPVTITTPESDC